MPQEPQHSLSAWQVAISLIAMHYGIGMLIGTGQEIALYGAAGMLFAFSAGLGVLSLLPVAHFYWKEKYPLWDLFEMRYDWRSAHLTSFLSAFWMIGLIAGFILGGSAAFALFGFSQVTSIVLIILPIYLLSLLRVKQLSQVFTGLLLLGSLFLLVVLWVHNPWQLLYTPGAFVEGVLQSSSVLSVSTIINICLITVLGMDFHQFIVRAQTPATARRGIVLGGIGLFLITFLIGASVLSAPELLAGTDDSIQTVPLLLLETGKQLLGSWGILFMLPILFVAIGSGSGITKVISDSVASIIPDKRQMPRPVLNAAILLISLLFSLTKASLVTLIVSFYAIYIAAVLVPFILYVLDTKHHLYLTHHHFFAVLCTGAATTGSFFLLQVARNTVTEHTPVVILIIGCTSAVLTSSVCFLLQKNR